MPKEWRIKIELSHQRRAEKIEHPQEYKGTHRNPTGIVVLLPPLEHAFPLVVRQGSMVTKDVADMIYRSVGTGSEDFTGLHNLLMELHTTRWVGCFSGEQ